MEHVTVEIRGTTGAGVGLVLRPWRDEDAESLVEAYRDPLLRRWTSHQLDSRDDALRWLAVQRDGWRDGTRLGFAVLADRADDHRLWGNVVLKRPDPAGGSAEVGYWTAAHARGRGVAPQALAALTDWAVDTLAGDGLTRLVLLHQVDNPASCRVADKAGYRFERVLPAEPPFPNDGHLHVRWTASG
ncbi:GNAT family N-acetyltransferase [Plantactinospora sp. GCM10030261]|uniref:GNAT family N-acetyltransferase n=1 Tax=Plantactinospora sp. GCM10030261 TaxID=3273420 RepID=UPI00361D6C67